jgi:hypothetical protein
MSLHTCIPVVCTYKPTRCCETRSWIALLLATTQSAIHHKELETLAPLSSIHRRSDTRSAAEMSRQPRTCPPPHLHTWLVHAVQRLPTKRPATPRSPRTGLAKRPRSTLDTTWAPYPPKTPTLNPKAVRRGARWHCQHACVCAMITCVLTARHTCIGIECQ